MNPSYCPSALYRSSNATTKPNAATAASNANRSGRAAKKTRRRGGGNRAGGPAKVLPADEFTSALHYTHALKDDDNVQGAMLLTSTSRWYTTMPT
ncbi:hypothetical protein IOCL2690_000423700 [Leishmania lindenbergi]|uniref:Uncharacterized protein n=1 Tax=Leishmania lindenbergi TaxID=651832 RepID=A0AAW3AFH8_9TRYP